VVVNFTDRIYIRKGFNPLSAKWQAWHARHENMSESETTRSEIEKW